ncbi:MAG TPA: tetratricopeptide repeat protein, partial [Burkholderiaceae bacterium]
MPRPYARTLCALLIAVAASAAALAGTKEDIAADMKAGRWAQADSQLQQVLAKHPDNALAHYWRAQVKLREGQLDAARADLAEAKRLDPTHAFAGDAAALAKLERELAPAAPAPRTTLPSPPQFPLAETATPAQPSAASHTGLWIALGVIALAALMVVATRSARKRNLDGERQQIRSQLEEAYNDLRDAAKAIDFRAELSPEQRLALSDRVLRAQGDVSAHLATLATRADLSPSRQLLQRVRDIAAEVRGEERPSEVEARRTLEAQRLQAMNQPLGSMPPPMGAPGSGLGVAGAALGGLAAGAVLGGLMSGSQPANAHTHADDAGGGP